MVLWLSLAIAGCAVGTAGKKPGSLPPTARKLIGLDQLAPPVAKPTEQGGAEIPEPLRGDVLKAEDLVNAGDFAAAKGLLETVAGRIGDNGRVAKDLALAYMGLGDRRAALEQLTKGAALAGDDIVLQMLVARLQADEGRPEAAIIALRTALQCSAAVGGNPLAAEALLGLAELLESQGYTTAAIDCYSKLYDWIGANGREYLNRPRLRELVLRPGKLLAKRGALLMELDRADQAREVLSLAFRRDRSDDQAAGLLMKSVLMMGDFSAAESLLLDLAAEPSARSYLPELAKMLCQSSGDKTMGLRIWKASSTAGVATGDLAVALVQACEALKAPAAAKEIADSALAKMPNDVAIGRYLAQRLLDQGDVLAALERLARLLEANPGATDAVDQMLQDVAAASTPEAQIDTELAGRAADHKAPLKYVMHYLAGRLATMHGDARTAEQQYVAAVADDSTFLPAYDAAVRLYLDSRRYEQASRLAAKLLNAASFDQALSCFAQYLTGRCHLATGRLAEAASALDESYACDDSFAPTVVLMADVYGRLGRQDMALQALGELVKLLPEDEEYYCRLFDQYVAMGQLNQAGATASKLVQVSGHEVTARAMMAELLLLAGKAGDGLRLVEELKGQDGGNIRVRLLGLRLAVGASGGVVPRQQYDSWLNDLGQILASGRADMPAKALLAELLHRAGQHDQAAAVRGETYEANPAIVAFAKLYVASLVQSGQLAMAEHVIVSAQALGGDLQVRQWLVDIKVRQGRQAAAIVMLSAWLNENRGTAFGDWCRLRLLGLYEELRQFDKAIGLLEEWLSSGLGGETQTAALATEVKLLCKAGRIDQAIEVVARADQGTASQALRLALVQSLEEANRYDQAHRLLDEWIRQGGQGQELLGQLKAALFVKSGQLDRAVTYARAWSTRRPGDLSPRQAVVAALADAGQGDRALALVDQWLATRIVPGSTQASSAAATGRPVAASRAATGRAATRPASRPATMTRPVTRPASATRPASRPASRRSTSSAASTTGPSRPAGSTTAASASAPTATAAATTGQAFSRAVAAMTRPARIGLGALPVRQGADQAQIGAVRSWCRQTAVRLLVAQGRTDEAMRRLDAYLAEAGKDVDLLVLQSSILDELGMDQEALAALVRAYAAAPGDAGVNNNLGYMLADRGMNLPQAEAMIRRALKAKPDNRDFLDSLGWVLYKQGNVQAAGVVFERLLEGGRAVWPGCALSYDHAGDVFYRLGWVDKAAELWAKAIALAGQDKIRGPDIRRILAEVPGKIRAARTGQPPEVAPLGQAAAGADQPASKP